MAYLNRTDKVFGVDALKPDAATCFCCHSPISGERVWLGEHDDGIEQAYPFHPVCADQPWPLYEIRRDHA